LFAYFYPVLILAMIVSVVDFIKIRRDSPANKVRGNFFNLSAWERPVFRGTLNYLLYSFICSFLAFVLILGSHVGSYLTYVYQLVLPLFFCWLFQRLEFGKISGVFFALLIVFNLFYWEKFVLAPRMLEQRDSLEWDRLYARLESSRNVLNSPTITSGLVELDLTPVDSGQTIYYYFVTPYPESQWIGPSYNELNENGLKYTKLIDDSIEAQKFDLIVTTKGVDVFYDPDLIKEHYSLAREMVLQMPQADQKWTIWIWEPAGN
jgi:hypothetical protein